MIISFKKNNTLTVEPGYITDYTGIKISVVLSMNDFKAIIEELEKLEDIRYYDDTKNCDEPSFPIDKAFKMIEAKRIIK